MSEPIWNRFLTERDRQGSGSAMVIHRTAKPLPGSDLAQIRQRLPQAARSVTPISGTRSPVAGESSGNEVRGWPASSMTSCKLRSGIVV